MNIEALRNFLAIVQAGSITKASADSFISQQGLNKSLTTLEHQIGYKLTTRSNRGVQLTKAGRIVEAYAKLLIELEGEMLNALSEQADGESIPKTHLVKIAATKLCLHTIVQPLIEQGYLQKATIVEATPAEAVRKVLEDGWLAISERPVKKVFETDPYEGVEARTAVTTRAGVVYRESCFPHLAHALEPADLKGIPIGISTTAVVEDAATSVLGPDALGNLAVHSDSLDFLNKSMLRGACVFFTDRFFWYKCSRSLGTAEDKVVFSRVGDYTVNLDLITPANPNEETRRFADALFAVIERSNTAFSC